MLMLGVVKEAPVNKTAPPVLAAYHFKVLPAVPIAERFTVPALQRLAGVILKTEGLYTVAITGVRGDVQYIDEVST